MMQTYNEFNNLNEKLNITQYRNIYDKTIKDLNINFYFISTFGTTIPVFYPIFDKLVKNSELSVSLTQTDIVLLSICSISILFNENKEQIEKIRNILDEKGAGELIDKGVTFIKSINNIFDVISKNTGKILNNIADIFSYTALYVPFLISFFDIIKSYNINFDTFTSEATTVGFTFSLTVGVITITLKHIINMLVKKMRRLVKRKTLKESLNFDLDNI